MDFSLSEEQTMLQSNLKRLLDERYDHDKRRAIVDGDPGYSQDIWRAFAEMGLLAAPFPEEQGGFGGPIETMVIMRELGRALVVEPWMASVVMAGTALSLAGANEPLGEMMEGMPMAFAWSEEEGGANPFDVATTATRANGGWVVSGRKPSVLGAPWAKRMVMTARFSGKQMEEAGVGLFLVEADAKGMSRTDWRSVDDRRASSVVLESAPAAMIGEEGSGSAILHEVWDATLAALCAEQVGAMRALLDATLDYSRSRKQFGAPLSKFQALQHRMVDMFMACEEAESMTAMATMKLGEKRAERAWAASAAKALIGDGARLVAQEAVQIHGGMGMTEELPVGRYFRRLTMARQELGDPAWHRVRCESVRGQVKRS